jgi:hypothetical protein
VSHFDFANEILKGFSAHAALRSSPFMGLPGLIVEPERFNLRRPAAHTANG